MLSPPLANICKWLHIDGFTCTKTVSAINLSTAANYESKFDTSTFLISKGVLDHNYSSCLEFVSTNTHHNIQFGVRLPNLPQDLQYVS